MDVKVEYQNQDDLKRLRHAYVLHIMDKICSERDRVFANDMIALEEKEKGRVTLANVFDIAKANEDEDLRVKKQDQTKKENESDEEEGADESGEGEMSEDEEEEELENVQVETKSKIQENLLVKQASGIKVSDEEAVTKDQGFTRPKVLILAPFKQVAF